MLLDEPLHRLSFLSRYVLIGVRYPSEQVGERGKMTGALGVEMVERVERSTQGRELRSLEPINAEPGANRHSEDRASLEGEDHEREVVVELPGCRGHLIDRAVQPLGLRHILERLVRK